MHQDFLTAIYRNESLQVVFDRLMEVEDRASEQRRRKLRYEYETADKILRALHEHIDSAPFRWAQSYMREAEAAEKKKSDDQLRQEAERRQIEAEYLEEKQKEIEYLRSKHSER